MKDNYIRGQQERLCSLVKSLIFAFFCLAVCFVIFLGLRYDDQAKFKGQDEDGKYKPNGGQSRGRLFSSDYRGKMPGDTRKSDKNRADSED